MHRVDALAGRVAGVCRLSANCKLKAQPAAGPDRDLINPLVAQDTHVRNRRLLHDVADAGEPAALFVGIKSEKKRDRHIRVGMKVARQFTE